MTARTPEDSSGDTGQTGQTGNTAPTGPTGQLPAQKAMKQFSKTAAERGEPVGPNDGPALTQRNKPDGTRPGDAGVGETDNQGSSPYADRSRPEKSQRET
jgi:hypothetical protein